MAVKLRVSVEEYLALPEHEKPYREYRDGDVTPIAIGDMRQSFLVGELLARIYHFPPSSSGCGGPYVRHEFLGATGPAFLIPDISYFAPDVPRRGIRAALPPALAIEVVSPDDTVAQQRKKCRFYRDNGVEAAWLFDPNTRIMEVFEGAVDGTVLRESDLFASTVLAGFELQLSELFDVLDA